ncbi:MAG: hypothetical protein NVSMB1_13860 [Polyangiales bacterium]
MKRSEHARAPLASTPAPLSLAFDIDDQELARQTVAVGARLGIEVRIERGGRGMLLEADATIAHTLRVVALMQVSGPLTLAANASARAHRYLDPLVAAGPPIGSDGATLREQDEGRIALILRNHLPIDLGEAPEANRALRESRLIEKRTSSASDEVAIPAFAEQRARAIVFGPSRTLSEVSSRRVLEAFGIGEGSFRLAENAARAVVHARATGYPVDLRIASPEASAIDERTLAAIALRTPNEVREGFRAIVRETKRLKPGARVLGVVVARTVSTHPHLHLGLSSSRAARAPATASAPKSAEFAAQRFQISLDDPIGRRLTRPLTVPVPSDASAVATALGQFEGHSVLPPIESSRGRALIDLILRLVRMGQVLSDALVRADIAPLAPSTAGDGWTLLGARVVVRGIDIAEGELPRVILSAALDPSRTT